MDVRRLVDAAQERICPDLVLKNGKVVNVFTGEILTGDVAVKDGYIVGVGNYRGKVEEDVSGKYVVPGFINAHLHVESSMVSPNVYVMEELRHGTTTVITDPHEIVNVGGAAALRDVLKAAESSPLNYYVMLPSCVPSTPFEHAGAELFAKDLLPFKDHPLVLGLGEMMNSVGVIQNDNIVSDKMNAFYGKIIDGHAPQLSGKALNAYAVAGIDTDHESISFEEAVEKLRCGIAVLVRDGSASKNLDVIIRGVVENGTDTSRLAFCTDDKHLSDIRKEGTISNNIRRSISMGLPPVKAIQMATINAANIYGLKHIGAVACGYKADMVVLDDLITVKIHQVYKDGVPAQDIPPVPIAMYPEMAQSALHPLHSLNFAPLPKDAFVIPEKETYSVIALVKNQIITKHLRMSRNEVQQGLKDGSIRKIAVIERHHATGFHACAYIKGYGLTHGAVGTTVAHDSHNIIVVGDNDRDMFAAVDELKRISGGYTIVSDGKVVNSLPLALGGLMSVKTADEFIPELDAIIQDAYCCGVDPDIDPFITLSFTALPVIPEIRITDSGLFDVNQFCFVKDG